MRTGLVIIGVAMAVVAVAVQHEEKVPTTAERRYVGPDGLEVEGLGACLIQPDSVACWNMDGVSDPKLASRVREYYTRAGGEVSFQVGKFNRWLLVRVHPARWANFETPSGTYANSHEMGIPGDDSCVYIARLSIEWPARTAALTAVVTMPKTDSVAPVPFKPGKIVEQKPYRIEFGKLTELPRAPRKTNEWLKPHMLGIDILPGSRMWTLPIGFSTDGKDQANGEPQFVPLDDHGNPIQHVDRDGNPASGAKVLNSVPAGVPAYDGPIVGNYSKTVFMAEGHQIGGAHVYYTNVNPVKLAALKVSMPGEPFRVKITDFPLDPTDHGFPSNPAK